MREGLKEKIAASIERIKAFEPSDGTGYHLAFSGGKDSVVLKHLADKAGVKYQAVYRVTGIDPPELVRFIKDNYPDVIFDIPRYRDGSRVTMWNLIVRKKMLPTRLVRYCCEYLKETAGKGMMTLTGVRWAESVNRAKNQGVVTVMSKSAGKEFADSDFFRTNSSGGVVLNNDNDESRDIVDMCYKKHKTTVNPIIDWEDADVWEYIHAENIPYCCLYDEGWNRIGCIGCPMANAHRAAEFARYPRYKALYIRAFDKMLQARKEAGLPSAWSSAEEVFHWWMEDKNIFGQMSIFDDEYDPDVDNVDIDYI